jgi:hypothetical protein
MDGTYRNLFTALWDLTGTKGVPMLKIILESIDGKIKFEKLSFSDGEYIFDNIPPGKYKVYPDAGDLSKRSLFLESEYQIVEIKNLEDGDIHEGIDFYVRKNK